MMRIKRSEKELVLALFAAEANGKSARYIENLRSTLRNKRAEKKAGRVEAAHKRWVTIKTNRANAVEDARTAVNLAGHDGLLS